MTVQVTIDQETFGRLAQKLDIQEVEGTIEQGALWPDLPEADPDDESPAPQVVDPPGFEEGEESEEGEDEEDDDEEDDETEEEEDEAGEDPDEEEDGGDPSKEDAFTQTEEFTA